MVFWNLIQKISMNSQPLKSPWVEATRWLVVVFSGFVFSPMTQMLKKNPVLPMCRHGEDGSAQEKALMCWVRVNECLPCMREVQHSIPCPIHARESTHLFLLWLSAGSSGLYAPGTHTGLLPQFPCLQSWGLWLVAMWGKSGYLIHSLWFVKQALSLSHIPRTYNWHLSIHLKSKMSFSSL